MNFHWMPLQFALFLCTDLKEKYPQHLYMVVQEIPHKKVREPQVCVFTNHCRIKLEIVSILMISGSCPGL